MNNSIYLSIYIYIYIYILYTSLAESLIDWMNDQETSRRITGVHSAATNVK